MSGHKKWSEIKHKGGDRYVTEILQTYTLELIGPPLRPGKLKRMLLADRLLRETEENLTDLLPEGYEVRIREWDAEEEHPHD